MTLNHLMMDNQTLIRPKGPQGYFLLGNVLEFMRRPAYDFFSELACDYPDIASYKIGRSVSHLITNPSYISDILIKKSDKVSKTKAVKRVSGPLLGNGLLVSDGELWKHQRQLLQPTLHAKYVESYIPTIINYTLQAMSGWENGSTVNFHREMMDLTRAVITKSLFNADLQETEGQSISVAIDNALDATHKRFKMPISLPSWLPLPSHQKGLQAFATLDTIINDLVSTRRQDASELNEDLLSVLVAMTDDVDKPAMTDQQLRDEIMTMFVAGHETSANALTWTLYLLITHPNAEQKVLDEISLLDDETDITYQNLKQLPYLDAVIDEAMRLYPPAWIFSRALTEDIQLGPYKLYEGEDLVLSPLIVQRSPKYFEDPENFDPSRFLSANKDRIIKGSYFPFGMGSRICIGKSLARLEIKIILLKILPKLKFTIDSLEPIEMKPSANLRPKNGLPVIVSERR